MNACVMQLVKPQEEATLIAARVPASGSTSQEHLWCKGLPRTRNPWTGEDDTEARLAQCERAYALRDYLDDHTVLRMRRKLYEAICTLRKRTFGGYLLDRQIVRIANVRPVLPRFPV